MANENAAPELRTSVQVTVSPMMGTGLPGCSSLTARTLVTTSSTSTTDATMSSSFIRRFGFRAVSDSSLTYPSSLTRRSALRNLSAMIAAVPAALRPNDSSPALVLLTTGGTIATEVGADGIARHASSGGDLLAASGQGNVLVEDLMTIDSAEMTPQRWQQIAASVRGHVAAGATGIVIAHGTDTLEETALWLALTCAVPVPVVLTGAQRSGDHPESDGPGNLRDALTVAASGEALGVVVCFAGQVFPAAGIRKVDLTATAGFAGAPPVGQIRDGAFVRTAQASSSFLGTVTRPALPRVDVVSLYPGADAVALDAFARAGAQGLVLESMGAGNANDAVTEAVSRHIENGIHVVVTTRVPGGLLSPGYAPGQKLIDAGAVVAPRLRAGQARVLLMAALATGSDLVAVIDRLG